MTAQKWNLTISLCNLSSSKVRASFNFVFITLSLNPIFILVLTKVKLHGSIIFVGSKNNVNHIQFFFGPKSYPISTWCYGSGPDIGDGLEAHNHY